MTSDNIVLKAMFEQSSIRYKVVDIKLTEFGEIQFDITNTDGSKKQWIKLTQEEAKAMGVLNLEPLKKYCYNL